MKEQTQHGSCTRPCGTATISLQDSEMAGLFQTEYTKGTAKTGVTSPNLLYKANNLGQ